MFKKLLNSPWAYYWKDINFAPEILGTYFREGLFLFILLFIYLLIYLYIFLVGGGGGGAYYQKCMVFSFASQVEGPLMISIMKVTVLLLLDLPEGKEAFRVPVSLRWSKHICNSVVDLQREEIIIQFIITHMRTLLLDKTHRVVQNPMAGIS